jgi:hypothetical protein
MTCNDFRQWLDEGRPERPRMNVHAATCGYCARELRAALELDRILSVVVEAPVHPAFNDAVMLRVHGSAPLRWLMAFLDVFAEPLVPLSLSVAIVLGLQCRPVVTAVLALSARLVQ